MLGHAAARVVLEDAERFSSVPPPPEGVPDAIARGAATIAKAPLTVDAPLHDAVRAAACPHAGTVEVAPLGEAIRAEARRLLDVRAVGRDAVAAYAAPLAFFAATRFLGLELPYDDRARRWTDDYLMVLRGTPVPEAEVERVGATMLEVAEAMGRALRAADPQGTDWLAAFATRELDPEAKRATAVMMLQAGLAPVAFLITAALRRTWAESRLHGRLREDPSAAAAVIEEALRIEGSVQWLTRVATRATTLEGCEIAEGDVLRVSPGAADRDPARFPDPDAFDPDREERGHLAFGTGPHSCIGAPLARLAATVALQEAVRALDWAPPAEAAPRLRGLPNLRGQASLAL